jgi:uncharacterized membrane protein YhaH (DUF805 family)
MHKLLTSSGRIGRGTWWMVQIALLLFSVGVNYFIFTPLFNSGLTVEQLKADPTKLLPVLNEFSANLPYQLLFSLVNIRLFVTSSMQRLHDRGSSGWRIIFAYVPIIVFFYGLYALVAHQSAATFLLSCVVFLAGTFISGVWIIVECGILPGDDSDNDYGPPPDGESRKAALGQEIASMAGASGGNLSKLDDDYIANYAKKIAMQQATSQMAASSGLGQSAGAKPAFGKR